GPPGASTGGGPGGGPGRGFGGQGRPVGQGGFGGPGAFAPGGAPIAGFGAPPGGFAGRFPGGNGTGPTGTGSSTGGLLEGSTPSAALTKALEANASSYKWVAATVGSNSASGYQLATGDPVMAIGGFNGTDPYPTLAEFQALVTKGQVHYFIPGGGGFGGAGGGGFGNANGPGTLANQATINYSSAITSWVESHFKSVTIGTTTVYDLTQPTSSTSGS